jgi:hypothetical protein
MKQYVVVLSAPVGKCERSPEEDGTRPRGDGAGAVVRQVILGQRGAILLVSV